MIALVFALGCGGGEKAVVEQAPAAPASMEGAECAVCGMVLREQPAPRGQALHRDGTRVFTCSLGDLRAHLQAPSPHGALTHVWVEPVDAYYDPALPVTTEGTWEPAESLRYVVGFANPAMMGRPATALRTAEDAQTVAQRLGGKVVGWEALKSTPFQQDP